MSEQQQEHLERPLNGEEDTCSRGSVSPEPSGCGEHMYYGAGDEDEEVPIELERTIATHLEKLSVSGSTLNDLEVQILRLRREYNQVKTSGLKTLQSLRSKLQTHITKTEPFVAVWQKARKVQEEAHKAATQYERAQSEYESAKETLRIAEKGLVELKEQQLAEEIDRRSSNACKLDQAWQETLANATLRVVKAEKERAVSDIEYRELTQRYLQVQEEHRMLEKKLKRNIERSKPYYETRYRCNLKLQTIRQKITTLEQQVKQHKMEYRFAMSRLESVSEGIHARRRSQSILSPAVSEPMLADRADSINIPDISRKAITPDLKRKDGRPNGIIDRSPLKPLFKGSSGSLPTIQASPITAHPTLDQQTNDTAKQIVTDSLSRALARYEQECTTTENDNSTQLQSTS